MRLWHEALIPYLPRQQLLGQHRECCALRGLGWGKKRATVDYVFNHTRIDLVMYPIRVMREMERRGYKPNPSWYDFEYRGSNCSPDSQSAVSKMMRKANLWYIPVYPEHNDEYLKECLGNLEAKGIHIDMEVKKNDTKAVHKAFCSTKLCDKAVGAL